MTDNDHPVAGIIRNVRNIFMAALVLGLVAFPALSQTRQSSSHMDDQALAELFLALSQSANSTEAAKIANRIWKIWLTPSPVELFNQMQDVMKARQLGDFGRAVRLLDEITANYPGYAEAFNQRATLLFLVKDYNAALLDLAETLRLEPRHFGALVAQAIIYQRLGKNRQALRSIVAALKIYPYLEQRNLFEQLLKPITRI
ncbi:Holliday junction DNA helicase RuvA [hydrothermal vent metagenome]|uniref:Holliday junction DNA helicase RuvA n=1 Tax=hydrothermal vent metagenome TaxID=652676 RepID=A0A3B0UKN1_9ZZZZ